RRPEARATRSAPSSAGHVPYGRTVTRAFYHGLRRRRRWQCDETRGSGPARSTRVAEHESRQTSLESRPSVLLRRKRSEPETPRRRRRRIRKLRLLALLAVLGVLAATAFSYGLVLAVGQQLEGLDPLRQQHQQVDGYIYAADGHTILDVLRGDQSRVLVPSRQISPLMKQAIVATEDK